MEIGAGDSGTDLEKKLGIGSADGAGEAWNVGPAYATGLVSPADSGPFKGGVECACLGGEVTTCFGRFLVLLFGMAELFRGTCCASLLV